MYCDEKIESLYGSNCVSFEISNIIPTTEYCDISVENVTLNGKRLSSEDIRVISDERSASTLSIR